MEPQKQQQPQQSQSSQQNTVQQSNQSNLTSNQPNAQQNQTQQPNNQNNQQNNEQDWQSVGNDGENFSELIQQAIQLLEAPSESQPYLQEQNQGQSSVQNQVQQQQTLGCQHYLRNCQIQAPCCKIYYTCKLCHDQKYQGPKSAGCQIERMAFDQVQNVKCLKCGLIQQPSLKCKNPQCQITFGKYACMKCKLYQNRSTKINNIFHCDQCKMCRRGKQQEFFHCKFCGYCRHISEKNNHKCAQNLGESQCPICLQVLKYSIKYFKSLPCGHLIHLQCLSRYQNLNCPVCGMALQKLSEDRNKQIEQLIEQTKGNLPKEFLDKKVDILCNQCLHKSYKVPFHFFGIKCLGCGTFNTKLI